MLHAGSGAYDGIMPDMHDERKAPLDIVTGALEVIFRTVVEDGEIEIGDRSPQDIFQQFESIAGEIVEGGGGFLRTAIDHRDSLLDRAKDEAAVGHGEMAATLYAIWIEHFVNGVLTRAFERMGYGDDVIIPLIKELRLPTKTTALWELAGLPALSNDDLRAMNRIIEFRNSFVHYKWSAHEERVVSERRAQIKTAVDEAQRFVSALQAVESSAFWNGRDHELIDMFRESIKKRWEEDPLSFILPRPHN
jgi:hypothetical protein